MPGFLQAECSQTSQPGGIPFIVLKMYSRVSSHTSSFFLHQWKHFSFLMKGRNYVSHPKTRTFFWFKRPSTHHLYFRTWESFWNRYLRQVASFPWTRRLIEWRLAPPYERFTVPSYTLYRLLSITTEKLTWSPWAFPGTSTEFGEIGFFSFPSGFLIVDFMLPQSVDHLQPRRRGAASTASCAC